MENLTQENEYTVEHTGAKALRFFAGVLVGSLAGASVMLLMAPHSGRKTRAIIQRKSNQLRHQTTAAVEDAVAQARAKTHQVMNAVNEKTEEIQHRGQEMLTRQKNRLSAIGG